MFTLPYTEVSMILLDDLAGVRRSYDLGIQLGVPESDLNDIEVDFKHSIADRRRATIRKWLSIDVHPSWSKLVRALVAISERHLARNIAVKYGKLLICVCVCVSALHYLYRRTISI